VIEIDPPPDISGCATCGSSLIWLYSFRTGRTFAAVPAADDPLGFRAHECRHAQDFPTWRAILATPTPDQPAINAAGRAAVEQALKNVTEKE